MLKKLKLRTKIFLIPVLACITSVLIFIAAGWVKNSNERLLRKVVKTYTPEQQLYYELQSVLLEVEDEIKTDAASGSRDIETNVEKGRQRLLQNLNQAEKNTDGVFDGQHLMMDVEAFISDASKVAEHVTGGSRESVQLAAIQKMTSTYKNFHAKLTRNIILVEKKISAELDNVRSNNDLLILVIGIVIFAGLGLSMAFSIVIIKSITKPMDMVIAVAEEVADGHLNIEVPETDSQDEIGTLLRTFKKMVLSLKELAVQIREASNALAASAGQISTSVTQIASAAAETASAATETNTTVEEVRQTAIDSNRKAKHVSDSSQKAVKISQAGEKIVAETIDEMNRIETQMESIADSIMHLSEHGQAISSIITTVEDVAEQSRLLAVNASIEAVKAGEQGKGFAVVAQEVRSLAEQSKQATNRIRNILDEIQKATSEAVMKTEQGSKAVKSGVDQSLKSGETIQRLANSVAEAAQATTQIAVSSQEQTVGMDQVVSAMESIKQASNQNVSATKQVESAAQDLYKLGQQLMEIVQLYKI